MSALQSDQPELQATGFTTLTAALDGALACLGNSGLSTAASERQLQELRQRLQQQRLQVAVLGQFKRGKSTFLNALLRDDLLPTAVVPLTAVPVYVEHGPRPALRIVYADGRPEEHHAGSGDQLRAELKRVATEEGNSGNHLGVSRIELFHPAPILHAGIVLIDTPGVGSTLLHNTQATLDFLSECDAALFVISPDPPITAAEIDFLTEIRNHVAGLVFILNKIDYLEDGDRDAAIAFLRKVLAQQVGLGPEVALFCISARRALRGTQAGDHRLVQRSGLPTVEEYLVDVVARQKAGLLQTALARKAGQALDAVLMQIGLASRSLTLPLDDLEARLAQFERALVDIERQRTMARDLLAGEKSRALEQLESDAEDVRTRALRLLQAEIDKALADPSVADPEDGAQAALSSAVRAFFPAELAEMSRLWQRRLAQDLAPYRQRSSELIEAVRRAAAELFEVPCPSADAPDAFEAARRPYWVTGEFSVTLDVVPQVVTDRFLPAKARRARQRRRLVEHAEMLVRRNVENLRWATLQNINDAFRRFGARLDQELAEAIEATHGAIQTAHAKRRGSSRSVATEVEDLTRAAKELEEVRDQVRRLAANTPEHAATASTCAA